MKATLFTSALAFCAVAVSAGEQQTAQQHQSAPSETHATTSRVVPQQTLSVAPKAAGGDSPLVAAAKRSGRLGKKPSAVITNDTLLKSGGHFTTTSSQQPLPSYGATSGNGPSASNAPLTTNNTPGAGAAPASKKDDKATQDANKKALKRAVADYAAESVENVSEDPAVQEDVIKQTATPKTAQAPKPIERPAAAAKPPL